MSYCVEVRRSQKCGALGPNLVVSVVKVSQCFFRQLPQCESLFKHALSIRTFSVKRIRLRHGS